jgi:sugar lactone lactonase YvrE
MKRIPALSFVVVLGLVALWGSISQPVAYQAPLPGTILTVVGTGEINFSGDGGPATRARLNNPWNLAFDSAGNLSFTDTWNNRVRKVGADGIITTVAGSGKAGFAAGDFAGDGGLATNARLNGVFGLAFDRAGNLFIGDAGNNRIRRVSPDGILTTVVGAGPAGFSGDGGSALQARINGPASLAVDSRGNLLLIDAFNNRIRRVSPEGILTTVVGGGSPADGIGDGGPATQARLKLPISLVVDGADNLFVGDFVNRRVRKVGADGIITTIAGGGNPADGLGDGGPATQARLNGPSGLAVDPAGNLFIADNRNFRVRKVSLDGTITTVAGTGQAGSSGDGGPATAARLNAPIGLAVDKAGNLFIADSDEQSADNTQSITHNNRIREVIEVAAPG